MGFNRPTHVSEGTLGGDAEHASKRKRRHRFDRGRRGDRSGEHRQQLPLLLADDVVHQPLRAAGQHEPGKATDQHQHQSEYQPGAMAPQQRARFQPGAARQQRVRVPRVLHG
jgi:hypothetical protein